LCWFSDNQRADNLERTKITYIVLKSCLQVDKKGFDFQYITDESVRVNSKFSS
jgi:hypothetical protein